MIEKLFTSLKEINGDKVYDLDNNFEHLKNEGWLIDDNTTRPDYMNKNYDFRTISIWN